MTQTGRLQALFLLAAALVPTACATVPPAADGELDCDSDTVWTEEGSVPEGTAGLADPADAVEAYLTPFMDNHGGEIVIIAERRGSLVVDDAEVVAGEATEMASGGFLVLTGVGCDGFDRAATDG